MPFSSSCSPEGLLISLVSILTGSYCVMEEQAKRKHLAWFVVFCLRSQREVLIEMGFELGCTKSCCEPDEFEFGSFMWKTPCRRGVGEQDSLYWYVRDTQTSEA